MNAAHTFSDPDELEEILREAAARLQLKFPTKRWVDFFWMRPDAQKPHGVVEMRKTIRLHARLDWPGVVVVCLLGGCELVRSLPGSPRLPDMKAPTA